jgi:hypothetical protein
VKTRYFVVVLWSTFMLCISVVAQTTYEETIVRSAYAKLRYALEQVPVTQLAGEAIGIAVPKDAALLSSDQRIAQVKFNITLSDFVVGKAQDVLTRRVGDLISSPLGERLFVASGQHAYIEHPKQLEWYEPKANWQPTDPTPSEVLNRDLQGFLDLQWQQKQPSVWKTYASYSVTVTYQGKTVGPYKALFMFGRNSKGEETIEPEDGTIPATALAEAMHEHLFADAFVSGQLRQQQFVRDWVDRKRQSMNCSETQGVCCDLVHLECGPDASLVEKARKGGLQ